MFDGRQTRLYLIMVSVTCTMAGGASCSDDTSQTDATIGAGSELDGGDQSDGVDDPDLTSDTTSDLAADSEPDEDSITHDVEDNDSSDTPEDVTEETDVSRDSDQVEDRDGDPSDGDPPVDARRDGETSDWDSSGDSDSALDSDYSGEMDSDAGSEIDMSGLVPIQILGSVYNNTAMKDGDLYIMLSEEPFDVDGASMPETTPFFVEIHSDLTTDDWNVSFDLTPNVPLETAFYYIAVLDRDPFEFPATLGVEDLLGSLQGTDRVTESGQVFRSRSMEICSNPGCHFGGD